ncbi:gamma-glutamyltransferase [Prosthecobacter sp.]|uniref:gamma-glutamyltransferase n=1 Tax=Prosthecobacter sp. TaxID=1965333 RepID=UPI003783C53B
MKAKALAALALFAPSSVLFAADAAFSKHAVATVQPLATEAAQQAFEKGGNAIDAAIAAGLTLGVVDGHNSGIGGGCFFVIRAADGTVTCIDGREMAPAKAQRDMYVMNGKLDDEASKTGALASGVPGYLKACDAAQKKHGKLKLADVLLPAAEIAEKGFPIDEVYARKLSATAAKLAKFPASAAIFLKDGKPLAKGDVLVQKDLAETYRAVAKSGTEWFYEGAFAQKAGEWMSANGGVMTAQDFAAYRAPEREAIRSKYRGYDLITMPPPSSGGVHVAQILNILEHFPIRHFRASSRVHVITEVMKLAFADRAYWLGDPDFAKVPRGLVDPAYAAELAGKIDLDHATEVTGHHMPPHWEGDVFGKHTTFLCTADAEGNWVALNQTINTAFGSKVVVPGTGVLLNDEMDDFAVQPGIPNAFKLVGAEANAVAPGKRPLSSMSPTIVLKDGKPVIVTGAAGGPTIITQALLLLTHIIDDGMLPEEALAEPRFHHQWNPNELKIEKKFGEGTLNRVKALGHKLAESEGFGACQAIYFDGEKKLFFPAHDPRVPGKADGK